MITLKKVSPPAVEQNLIPVPLTDETIAERKKLILKKMREAGYDSLVFYADLEHGSNFEYLTGFLPRFEEALLILHQDGKAYGVFGNENLNKAQKARIDLIPIHMPHLSLPNQPMETKETVAEILAKCHLANRQNIGIIGWKYFTNTVEEAQQLFDLPYFVMDALKKVARNSQFTNATGLLIGENGARTTNNANEFAHYEFGAALAGNCLLEGLGELAIGKTEMAVAEKLSAKGQDHTVVTIMAAGPRFVKANLYPSNNQIALGDPISMTTAYKGGLESRTGFAVHQASELPAGQQDYLEKLVIPYFKAFTTWLETIQIGITGGELYATIEAVFPKASYGWSLNPGHLGGDEEWLASPVYPDSQERIRSGMLFQIDLIPSLAGYQGAGCESSVFLADEKLREQIKADYPEAWARIIKRRAYLEDTLGIRLGKELLPMSPAMGYYPPFMLDRKLALVKQ